MERLWAIGCNHVPVRLPFVHRFLLPPTEQVRLTGRGTELQSEQPQLHIVMDSDRYRSRQR